MPDGGHAPPPGMAVCAYVTDVEGNLDYFERYVAISKVLAWAADSLSPTNDSVPLNVHRYAHAQPLFFRPCCARMRGKYSARVAWQNTRYGCQ